MFGYLGNDTPYSSPWRRLVISIVFLAIEPPAWLGVGVTGQLTDTVNITGAKFISSNAVKATWAVTVGGVTTTPSLGASEPVVMEITLSTGVTRCTGDVARVDCDLEKETYVFWDLQPRELLLCMRLRQGDPNAPYTSYSAYAHTYVRPSDDRPPRIVRGPDPGRRVLSMKRTGARDELLEPVTLTCQAEGQPQPSVTWYRDSTSLEPDGVNVQVSTSDNTLQLVGQFTSDRAGSYWCRAHNSLGIATSDSIELVPQVFETGSMITASRPVDHGRGEVLDCAPPHSVPKAVISWKKLELIHSDYGQEISRSDVILDKRVTQTLSGSLAFANTVPSDSAVYHCVAEHEQFGHAKVICNISLNIADSPGVFDHPPDRLLYPPSSSSRQLSWVAGQEARIQCVFQARPAPDITWYHNKSAVVVSNNITLESANQVLVIGHVTSAAEGEYECGAMNQAGRDTVNKILTTFTVRVQVPPTFATLPTPARVKSGKDASFICVTKGVPRPGITWTRNGEELFPERGGGHYTISSRGMAADSDESTLTLHDITKDDRAAIGCRATNVVGSVYTETSLNVYARAVIHDVTQQHFRSASLGNFTWLSCDVETDPSLSLTLTWFLSREMEAFSRRVANKSLLISWDDAELTSNPYVVRCRAEDELEAVERGVAVWVYGVDWDATTMADHGEPTTGAASLSTEVTTKVMLDKPTKDTGPLPDVAASSPNGGASAGSSGQVSSTQTFIIVGAVVGGGMILALIVFLSVKSRRGARISKAGGATSYLDRGTSGLIGSTVYYRTSGSEMTRIGMGTPNHVAPLDFLSDDLRNALREVEIPKECLLLGEIIGKGQFGRVHVGTLLDLSSSSGSTKRVAVKTLKYKADETEMVELFVKEALMMKDFSHPNVLSLIGVVVANDGSPMAVLPYMANGDLRAYMMNAQLDITVLSLLKLGLQVAHGMVYLSANRFVHRDLAARNCMVDDVGTVRVADFGLSRDLYSREYYRPESGQSPLPIRWMAPECLECKKYSTASDVWSFGVLLWELLTRGAMPYTDIDNWDVQMFVSHGKRLPQPMYCPSKMYEIMLACWEQDPKCRPSFDDLVVDLGLITSGRRENAHASTPKDTLYMNITSPEVTSFR